MRRALVTFGHGTASADRIADLLLAAGVELVVDVRTAPGSRRNPHVARAELERWLPARGIGYRWDKRLGGFRRPPADSPDVFWREAMFRGYAAHLRTPEFAAAVDALLAGPGDARLPLLTGSAGGLRRACSGQPAPAGLRRAALARRPLQAVMCSESVWWRCHRRMIADFLVLVHEVPVRHLMHDGRLVPHEPSPGARVASGLLVYDGGQEPLL